MEVGSWGLEEGKGGALEKGSGRHVLAVVGIRRSARTACYAVPGSPHSHATSAAQATADCLTASLQPTRVALIHAKGNIKTKRVGILYEVIKYML